MRRCTLLAIGFLFTLACRPGKPAAHFPNAGAVLLINGHILTQDASHPIAEAIAIKDGAITAVGGTAEVTRDAPATAHIIDLAGRTVLPGFIDAHVHLAQGALEQDGVDLTGAETISEIQARLRTYARANPDRPWLLGHGWSYRPFAPVLPSRELLDAIEPSRPVLMWSYDGHTGWVNSRALEVADVGGDTPDPPGGRIVRDDKGQPTGALVESAIALVSKHRPAPTAEARRRALISAAHMMVRAGITTICEIGGNLDDLALYEDLARDGQLPLRVVFAPTIAVGARRYKTHHDRLLSARTPRSRVLPGPLKDFVDGVVESNTAALLAPYADGSGPGAPPRLTRAMLREQIRATDALGLDLAYHAIGDRAVRDVLDALTDVEAEHPRRDRRLRIEHIEVIAPADLPRLRTLGAIASMMPLHAAPGEEPEGAPWSRKLGPDRLSHAFAFRSVLDAGAWLAFGSDWPVMGLDPLRGVAIAVTRSEADGEPRGGWIPAQRITTREAMAAYTRGSAFALRIEDLAGSLRPGMAADLVVLSQGVNLEDARSWFTGAVDLTIAQGRVFTR